MTFKLLRQILIIGLSVAVIFLYIQPKLVELRGLQAEVREYDNAVKNATEFTNLLRSQLNLINNIAPAQERALEVFLPRTVDPVVISRDLQTIAQRNSMLVQSISYAESISEEPVRAVQSPSVDPVEAELQQAEPSLVRTPLTITVQGTYDSFLTFLRSLEANIYPLRTVEVGLEFVEPSEELAALITDPVGTYTVTVEAISMEIPL